MVKYTREQRLRAVRLYERYDRGAASVINELGCPSRLYFVKLGCTASSLFLDGVGACFGRCRRFGVPSVLLVWLFHE